MFLNKQFHSCYSRASTWLDPATMGDMMPSQRELSQGMVCFFALGNPEGSEHPRAQYLAWKQLTILYLGHRTYVSLRGGNRALIIPKYGMLVYVPIVILLCGDS